MGLTVYTGGTFDLFHSGHVQFLRRCADLGRVVVSLNTDEFVKSYKPYPPHLQLPRALRGADGLPVRDARHPERRRR